MNEFSRNNVSFLKSAFSKLKSKNFIASTAISLGICILMLLVHTTLRERITQESLTKLPEVLQQLPPFAYNRQIPTPEVTAKNVFIFDPVALSVLYEKNSDVAVPPASTTKLMTAIVALKTFELSDTITLPSARIVVGSSSKISSMTSWSVDQLLYALLVSSGNDVAIALAQAHPQGYDGFVQEMNQTAKELGLSKTHFNNVSGLDSPGHIASARDLAFLTMEAMSHPLIREVVSSPQVTIHDISGKISSTLYSTNTLLTSTPGVKGVKTGTTEEALECLITWVERDGHPILLVVLGSSNRFDDTQQLIEWVYENFEWIQI